MLTLSGRKKAPERMTPGSPIFRGVKPQAHCGECFPPGRGQQRGPDRKIPPDTASRHRGPGSSPTVFFCFSFICSREGWLKLRWRNIYPSSLLVNTRQEKSPEFCPSPSVNRPELHSLLCRLHFQSYYGIVLLEQVEPTAEKKADRKRRNLYAGRSIIQIDRRRAAAWNDSRCHSTANGA